MLHAWWEAAREPEEIWEWQIWDWVTGRVGGKAREQKSLVGRPRRAARRLESPGRSRNEMEEEGTDATKSGATPKKIKL